MNYEKETLRTNVPLCFPYEGLLAFGVKESTTVNKIFTAVNILVLVFVVIGGFITGDIANWHITLDTLLNHSDAITP